MIQTRNHKRTPNKHKVIEHLSKNARKQKKLQEDIVLIQNKIGKMQCKLEQLQDQLRHTKEHQSMNMKDLVIILDDEVDYVIKEEVEKEEEMIFVIEDTEDEHTDDDMTCYEWYPSDTPCKKE
jgi:hypothetical protein